MDIVKALDLNNPSDVTLDDSGVTSAYFNVRKPVAINKKTIKDLKLLSLQESKDLRICLHHDNQNIFHDMVLVQHSSNYHPPHKHPTKPECYHIIEGELGAIHFNEEGKIIKKCKLSINSNFIYRIDANEYHVVFPLSKIVVYHESKPGPFIRNKDFIEPDWVPNIKDEESLRNYHQMIHNVFENQDA